MAKKVYALYRTDNWHTHESRELLVVEVVSEDVVR
jgi:hypothetical protein